MVNGNILTQMEIAVKELPASERKVGEYILEHKKDIINMTITELAEKSGTSSAAVVRLCRSIGISGFPNLKIRLSALVENNVKSGYYDIEPREEIGSIIKKTVSNINQTVQDTSMQLDEKSIQKAINILKESETIYFYGVGASFLIAEDAAQKFARVGKNAYAISDRHVLAMSMASQQSNKKANVVFFGISYSGEKEEVVKLMNLAKDLGVKVIGLSRTGNNTVKNLSDVALSTARAPEAELRSAATSSRFGQLFVIDLLFFSYVSSQYDKTIEQLQKTKQAVQKL